MKRVLVSIGCQLANPAQAGVHPEWLRGRPGRAPGGQCGRLVHPGAYHHCLQFDNMSQLKLSVDHLFDHRWGFLIVGVEWKKSWDF